MPDSFQQQRFGRRIPKSKMILVYITMGFFTSAINTLRVVTTALGAGVSVWGLINLLEGYGNDNPGAKSQGVKQLMAGGGIVIIATQVIPLLANLFS